MLKHIAKLTWNRRNENVLIIVEIFITILVLFGIISMLASTYQTFNKPLGFEWQNTWSIKLTPSTYQEKGTDRTIAQIAQALRQRNEIDKVTLSSLGLFTSGASTRGEDFNGKYVSYLLTHFSLDSPKDLGVTLVEGRWFGEQDLGQNYTAVMVNQQFADEILAGKQAIGFERPYDDFIIRIVGVFKDYRHRGHLRGSMPYMFYGHALESSQVSILRNINIAFKQPQSPAYEQKLREILQRIAPNWNFKIDNLKDLRQQQINEFVTPMMILSVVVGFLLLMVAMGLFGVLWQNINRRTKEIGLRRALGASEGSIQAQIIGELLALTLFASLIAFALLLQIPLLELIEVVSWTNFWLSITSAVSVMILLVILCAWLPSRMAIKLAPSDALHYE
ncbi:MAG: FtsX-like permease family protein [Psychrobium sp.]|nr:FtsX-like permease family protein [Psychrobium sp.]